MNAVPEGQFDFDGFGWAYQVFRDSELLFRVVLKAGWGKSEDEVQKARKWGWEKTLSIAETGSFERGSTYCYYWEVGHGGKEVSCEEFLKL